MNTKPLCGFFRTERCTAPEISSASSPAQQDAGQALAAGALDSSRTCISCGYYSERVFCPFAG